MNPINVDKAKLREQLQQTREAIPEDIRKLADQCIRDKLLALPQLQSAKTVFCYISLAGEVDTHALIETLQTQNKQIAVPKIVDSREMIATPFTSWEELKPYQLGILAPSTNHVMQLAINICITPGLGFSPAGVRLGYGNAYYDTWFSKHPVPCKIGIGYECQIVDTMPCDETDIRMDVLVTEKRVINISS